MAHAMTDTRGRTRTNTAIAIFSTLLYAAAMKKFLFVVVSTLLAASAFAQNPAIIPVPRSTPANWMSRHEGFLAEAKQGPYDLVFLGDSITDGWRKKGADVWAKHYAPRRALNLGIGGDRTQHVLWRIENGELDGLKPKAVVLMIGTNNSNSDDAPSIAAGIELIVQKIRAKCPGAKVLLLAVFPRNKPTDSPAQLETLREINRRIAKLDDGKTVRFLDINAKFLGADGKVPAAIMPDFLHPNETGYQIWAEAMEPTLTAMLK